MDILTRNCRQLFHIQEILLLNYQDIKLQSMQVTQIPTESHFFANSVGQDHSRVYCRSDNSFIIYINYFYAELTSVYGD